MIKKPLQEITMKDIYQLMNLKIGESRTLDYKLELHVEDKYSDSREARKELLRDLCAFANTDGGDLIIGIREENGVPKKIEGMEIKNIDGFKLLLDNLIIDGIEPNIQYDIKTIPMRKDRFIIIIRVYKNWIESPFRVCYKNENRFYGRQSSRKYELDLSELRSRFNFTVKIKEEIEKIRENGVKKVYHSQHPIYFPYQSVILLHLVPLLAFEKQIKLKKITKLEKYFLPLYEGEFCCNKWNFDGYLIHNHPRGGNSYIQIYENGVVEVVDGYYLSNGRYLLIDEIEKQLVHKLKKCYLIGMQQLEVQPPLFIYLTFINVKGFQICDPIIKEELKLDRKELKFTRVMVNDYRDIENIESILSPIFEVLWRSFGINRGYSFYELNDSKLD